jgi:hypothetical protein
VFSFVCLYIVGWCCALAKGVEFVGADASEDVFAAA